MKPWVAGIRICKDLLVLKIESVYTVLIFLAGSKTVRIGSGFDPVLVDRKENQILTIFLHKTILWAGPYKKDGDKSKGKGRRICLGAEFI